MPYTARGLDGLEPFTPDKFKTHSSKFLEMDAYFFF
jgi:hypothetical protein